MNEAANRETAALLAQLGYADGVTTMTVDLSNRAEIERAGERVRNEIGVPDIVFNNAGISFGRVPIEQFDFAKWDLTMAVNCRAIVFVSYSTVIRGN